MGTLLVYLSCDPSLDPLWTARAACDIPANPTITQAERITTFSYDVEGRLAQKNSPEGVINYEYDLATGRHVRTCTQASETAYEYDALGRLWKVHVLKRWYAEPLAETTTYEYTAVGSRKSVTLPNGVKTDYAYDSLNRLTGLTNRASDTSILSLFNYQVDQTGRRTNAVEILKLVDEEATSYQTNTLTWQYDGLYRLTNETYVSTIGGSYTNSYQYDKAGNRWSKVRLAGGTTTTITNQYNANDQLLVEVTRVGGTLTETNLYNYDANGSLIARTNISSGGEATVLYGYDLRNKLSSATTAGSGLTNYYTYNDQGIRVRTISGGTTTKYLIDANNHTGYAQVLEELTDTGMGSSFKTYVLGDDVLAQSVGGFDLHYYLYDGHGSTRQLVHYFDDTVLTRHNYDAYGVLTDAHTDSSIAGSIIEPSLLYCGELYDSTLNMYNLRARFYDPSNGRFNARDTFMGNNEDPQSLHKYAYCHGDPVNRSDPSGLFTYTETLTASTIQQNLQTQKGKSDINKVQYVISLAFALTINTGVDLWIDKQILQTIEELARLAADIVDSTLLTVATELILYLRDLHETLVRPVAIIAQPNVLIAAMAPFLGTVGKYLKVFGLGYTAAKMLVLLYALKFVAHALPRLFSVISFAFKSVGIPYRISTTPLGINSLYVNLFLGGAFFWPSSFRLGPLKPIVLPDIVTETREVVRANQGSIVGNAAVAGTTLLDKLKDLFGDYIVVENTSTP